MCMCFCFAAFAEELPVVHIWISERSRTDHMMVYVHNSSDKPIRLWDTSFSEGYYMFSFRIDTGNGIVTVKRKQIDFTRNIPRSHTIAPNDSSLFAFDLSDESWVWSKNLIKNRGLKVSALLEIVESEGTKEKSISVLRHKSDPILTLPSKIDQPQPKKKRR